MKFRTVLTLEQLNARGKGTLVERLGIEYTGVGDDWLEARMPVDHRTVQPMGLLHGGASVALAETIGSLAAFLMVDKETQAAVGLEINANHVKSARSGFVTGRTTPLHIGRTVHVWEIKIVNDQSQLVCVSRLTAAIIDKPSASPK